VLPEIDLLSEGKNGRRKEIRRLMTISATKLHHNFILKNHLAINLKMSVYINLLVRIECEFYRVMKKVEFMELNV